MVRIPKPNLNPNPKPDLTKVRDKYVAPGQKKESARESV